MIKIKLALLFVFIRVNFARQAYLDIFLCPTSFLRQFFCPPHKKYGHPCSIQTGSIKTKRHTGSNKILIRLSSRLPLYAYEVWQSFTLKSFSLFTIAWMKLVTHFNSAVIRFIILNISIRYNCSKQWQTLCEWIYRRFSRRLSYRSGVLTGLCLYILERSIINEYMKAWYKGSVSLRYAPYSNL